MEKKKPNPMVIAGVLAVHACIATLTWRDIERRPASSIRGPKPLWRVASAINALGSAGYWLFARR